MRDLTTVASHVIIGGGITGLLAAHVLAQRKDGRSVMVIESADNVGGLLRSFDYGEFGHFDHGTHIMAETGETQLDKLLFDCVPDGDWLILEGAKRDLAGIFFDGRLQLNSIYMDLRNLPTPILSGCVGDFMLNLGRHQSHQFHDASAYAISRFGESIANRAVIPSVEKLFGVEASKLDPMATMLTSMERVILFDETSSCDLMNSELMRDRIAYPEQRNLPSHWASSKRSYYPKGFGMHRFISGLRLTLQRLGVKIFTNASLQKIEVTKGQVSSLQILHEQEYLKIGNVASCCWTVGAPQLTKLLGLKVSPTGLDKALRTVVVNLLVDKAPATGDLYYFYCYDKGFKTFRVTNYSNYCGNAPRQGMFPLSIELLVDSQLADDSVGLLRTAITEIKALGVLDESAKITFSKVEVLANGFPMPTTRNLRYLDDVREAIQDCGLTNLYMLGIFSRPRLFFQRDIMIHTYRTLIDANI